MRVLIVGCGYIGLPLGIELVRLGHKVFGLRRNHAAELELKAAGLHPLFADITKPDELKSIPRDFDWVVNCTASSGGGTDDYRKIYLEGNRNLVSSLADSPVKKFVYTSSTSVYGQNDGSVVTEKSPVAPEAGTSQVLVETENLLRNAVAERNFPAVILRVAGIYGPGRGHSFKQFLRGEARIEGEGTRWLNMIHRDDLIGVIIAALERATPGEIYNAVDRGPVNQRNFFEWLAAELRRPMPETVSAGAEILRRRGVTDKHVTNTKLLAELKYRFRYPDFRAGYKAEIARLKLEDAPEL
jgi:nucleoside-diphosphate-sugar epimerase